MSTRNQRLFQEPEPVTNCLFAFGGSKDLGASIAEKAGLSLSPLEEIDFEDGEHKIRPLVNVLNREVTIIYSLFGEPGFTTNDKLCRLMFFVGTLRDAGAARVSLLAPYLCYSRKERRCNQYDPICTRYVAQMMEAVGLQSITTMDVHNQSAFENSYRIAALNLEAQTLFVEQFADDLKGQKVAVISPDSGGVKRAENFRVALQEKTGQKVSKGFVEKLRDNEDVWGHTLIGDVRGRTVVIIDDLIANGTTLAKAAEVCKEGGATKVLAGATHGVFTEKANRLLATPALDRVVITDSIPPFRITSSAVQDKLQVLSTASTWARLLGSQEKIKFSLV